MADARDDEAQQSESEPYDPGPDTVDPAPWLGQVGEGATLPSGEAIAREIRQIWHRDPDDDSILSSRD